jgi:predicted O-linked N-acetylglucosamine transferase (SPINDLY family)
MQASELENLFRQACAKHSARDYSGAKELYLQILSACPDHPDVTLRLAGLTYETGAYDEAVTLLERAAQIRPGLSSVELMLAMSLRALQRYAEAEPLFLRYTELPDSDRNASYACFNLASMYMEGRRFEPARELCMRSLARFRGDRAFMFLFGQISLAMKNYDDAIAAFDGAMQGAQGEVFRTRSLLMASQAFKARKDYTGFVRRAEPEIARSSDPDLMVVTADFHLLMGNLDDVLRLQSAAIEKKNNDFRTYSYQLKNLTESDNTTEEQIFAFSRLWDEKFGTPKDVPAFTSWNNGPLEGRKIRVGILSRTFRRHVTLTILRPLLPELAKRFELYGYYDDDVEDTYTEEVRRSFAVWRNTSSLGMAEAAGVIHNDALDVLIDISGHFNSARTPILSYRPAPVQIHYADSSSSLGLSAVQYRFSDAVAEPPERGDPFSSETVLRLPHGFFLYQPLEEIPSPAACPAEKNGCITFGSCTALFKITPTTLRLWRSALEAVPGSVFLLARDEFEKDIALRDMWFDRFEKAGIPKSRVRIETGTKEDFVKLRFYNRIDIALDAFPYSGVTTTLDALWMGVPVVNYRETRLINRMCSSLLTRVGLDDLVADTFDDYAAIAAKLAADRDKRRKLRRNLRDTMRLSPLCDPAGMAADMDDAIRGVLRLQ